MAHISRASKKKLDPDKLRKARHDMEIEHVAMLNKGIADSRRANAASAKRQFENDPRGENDWKLEGVFSWPEFVFCQMQYGKDFIQDADFLNFWRKANDQEYLKFA
jgi:hypothetical protein